MSTQRPAGKLPWSVPVALGDIPEDGKRFDLVADLATRDEVAKLAGLRALPRLQATFHVSRHGADGVRVEGEVSASVGQSCVVTLEPIDSEVREAVDLVFAPPPRMPLADKAGDADADSDVVAPDEREVLSGDRIDLGAVATEFLILGIDPYPRKPGATFQPPAAGEEESGHPFAALAALKKGSDPEK